MPEGDTIFRTAVQLRAAIEECRIVAAEGDRRVSRLETLADRTLTSIESRGKHLLMHFDDQRVLHSHMGMTGSWHLYHLGEPWQKPRRRAAAVLHTDSAVAVCFSPKTIDLLSPDGFRRNRYLQQLGPDLLATGLDVEEVLRRFRLHDLTPLGEAVMNQTIACGIGNVYKSEVLFVLRLNPFEPVQTLNDEQIRDLIETARSLMQRNLEGYPRRTRFRGSHRQWVYGRSGEPCFECGTRITLRRQGDLGRSTYWCERCQGPAKSTVGITKPR